MESGMGLRRNVYTDFKAAVFSVGLLCLFLHCASGLASGEKLDRRTNNFHYHITYKTVTRMGVSQTIAVVNNQYPGPTAWVTVGDRVVVKVTSHIREPVTLHWHGLPQRRQGWFDGPAWITQCPIRTGQTFVHDFVVEQTGSYFWHAHDGWLRGTVYGAFIIKPRSKFSYPWRPVSGEFPIILGEWYKNRSFEDLRHLFEVTVPSLNLLTGKIPDGFVINGLLGPSFNESAENTFRLDVLPNRRYLLRVINANVNFPQFFAITNHIMEVVEIDGSYIKPILKDVLALAPGQTAAVIIHTNQPPSTYFMAGRVYISLGASFAPPQAIATPSTAILHYINSPPSPGDITPALPHFPASNDTAYILGWEKSLRSLNSFAYPTNTPKHIDRFQNFALGYETVPCDLPQCNPALPRRMVMHINYFTYKPAPISLLQAVYMNIDGVYETDFPEEYPPGLDITQERPNMTGPGPTTATKVSVLEYGSSVQVVLQNTYAFATEDHPFHLHGHYFHVVGTGFGVFDWNRDRHLLNLEDPVIRHTVNVPALGWTVIRFVADNPGVWAFHCHVDLHQTWGMLVPYVVKGGGLPPPPSDLPDCETDDAKIANQIHAYRLKLV